MTLQSNATFVKTKAFESTLKRLQKTGFVVINGNHGEGTSTIALHLISGKRYLRLSTPNDWRLVSIKNCDAIFIDDIFGVAVLEEENVKCWRPVLEEIREAVLKKDIIVLITIKPHILRQAKKYLFYKLSNWFADNVITVKSETISIDERYEILKSHLEANERKIDIDALKSFVSSYENNPETMFQIGFPQRANMYAEFSQFFEKGFTFLEKPIYFVKNCLSDVLSEEKSFLAFFFLWSQLKHTLRITELDDMEERSEISCRLKQQNVFSVSYVKEALLSHKDGFINYIEDSEEFRFSHDIIADVVGLLVCEKNIKDGINLCSLDFLLTYVTTADETEDESIVKVYIKKSRFELLHKRLLYFYRSNKMAVNHDAFGNENFVSVLKEKEDKEEVKNFEIFHDACTVGAIQTVSCMLNCGIEGHEVKGFSPIHMAANSNHCEIVSLFVKRNPELLKLKISGGENEYQKYQGATVLHIASLNGYETMINILLSLGADVNLRDCEGNTPLLLSIKEEKYRITRIFLKHEDVEINTPDINGSTPLMEAVKNNLNIAKSLLQKQNVDINCINSKNQTALDIALSKGADNIVKRLKTKGAETAK
ncbi:uncharacterized protein LOC132738263 [Ruditapes philippinarum]|uniref:uncharacterized protein LOC132738263 n=1 Tax=Ruditapes philippinarum TaxID=129788 RepID=UPI00295B6AED|nr:uncharacterized protein LOC132738263 [Ruditapes philippinarum]